MEKLQYNKYPKSWFETEISLTNTFCTTIKLRNDFNLYLSTRNPLKNIFFIFDWTTLWVNNRGIT